jgi:hypothetical protein
MDRVFLEGDQEEVKELKTVFGLEAVEHSADVMSILAGGPFLWQENR